MQLTDKLFSPQGSQITEALDRTAQRQAILMNNLANVNVPGYKRQDMDFHVQLQGIPGFEDSTPARDLNSSGPTRQDGSSVDIEREIASIAETEIHYQALADISAKLFAGLKNVIREGK